MFRQCTDLNKVALSSQLNYVGQQSFRYCESLKDIDLSNTVITIIRSAAFHGCKSSSYIILPQTLQQMSEWGTFADCNSLVYIKCLAPTPPSLGSEAFVRTNNCPIYVPDESVNAYKTATNWSAYANRIKPLSELKENF